MGLDMYLFTNSKVMSKAVNAVTDDMPEYERKLTEYRAKDGIVCQWRKANQIHAWFVKNVQDGRDDCGHYPVSIEQLEKLRDVVRSVLDSTRLVPGRVMNGYTYDGHMNRVYNMEDGKVLEDDSMARKLLPTEDGFFFGGTEYDQWYWFDLEDTLTQLDKILGMVERKHGEWDYNCKGEDDWNLTLQYHSSW